MKLTNLEVNSIEKVLILERTAKKFGLTNIRKFLKLINNPEKDLKIIHVAGTNGKGSVCAMMSSVLNTAGYKVGMFTSPHLVKINERIRISNKLISNKDFNGIADRISNLEKKHNIPLTFFETLTVIAFLYFKEKKVDYAVIETGMGGRLDATNTAKPILSIITNIGLEHKDVLGNTLKDIAREKAGIIKNNSTVVTSARGKALSIIKKMANKKNSRLIIAKRLKNIELNLKGDYQIENASTAVAALKELKIPEKHVLEGLKKVCWPGRFEFIKKNILLDCAHNPDGVKALVKSMKELDYNNLIVILSVMKDKNIISISKKINNLNPKMILTKANVSRARDPRKISRFFKHFIIIPDLKKAITYAREITKKDDLILITGSIFLVGEAYSFLNHLTPR